MFIASAQIGIGNFSNTNTLKLDYRSPQEFIIGGITISGVSYLDKNALIALTGLQVGDQILIPGDGISLSVKKLWEQGLLGNVEVVATKVEGNYIFLEYRLEEKPRLTKFAFDGVRKAEADEIRESIRLIRGRVITDAVVANTKTKVEKFYVKKGFRNAQVDILLKDDTLLENSVVLLIKVNKNKKVKIDSIGVEGNISFTDKKLRRKMKETKQVRFFRLTKASRYLENAFEKDKQGLIEFYNSKGYRDAVVEFDSVYDVNNKRLAIDLKISEGNKYYFGNISWTGNYIYDDKILSKILGIKRGEVYNKDLLDKRINFNPNGQDITSLYMDDGYLFFGITPVEIAVRGDSIDLEMRIVEGEQAIINEIIVKGNTKTSDHVIRRELRTLPGQKFSRADIIRSQRELSQLGYFDPEKMGINPIPHPEEGTVDIEYTVEEKANDQFTLSGGWGGFYGFVGTVGLVFNNFSARKITKFKEYDPLPGGDGQRIAIQAQANGLRYQSYSLTFTEPWLGGRKPNSLSVSLSNSIQRGLDSRGDVTFRIGVLSASVFLGRRLTFPDDFFTLSNSISITQYNIFNYASIFGDGKAYSLTFNNTVSRNSIDNPTYPRNGSSFSLSSTFTPPYSLFKGDIDYDNVEAAEKYKWLEFHKWLFDADWYTKLAGNLVLNTRAHFGFLGSYNKQLGIGPFERFKLGGSGIRGFNFLLGTEIVALRGYGDNELGGNNNNGNFEGVTGGVVFNKFVAELRYPISLNPMATVYPLVFFDLGNTWDDYSKFNPFRLYRSTGAGVRIFMPMFGLIGFDWGYGLDRNWAGSTFKNRMEFHFMIGQQIR